MGMPSDFVLVGWQEDDLPIFGRIQYIAVINEVALCGLCMYFTYGIDRHFHSFTLNKTGEMKLHSFTELVDNQSYRAHVLQNGVLCLTFRYHVENLS